MKLIRVIAAILLGAIVILFASCGPSGTKGESGVWLKGKALSVKASFTTAGALVYVRNDSDHEVSISPVHIIVWGGEAGKSEFQFSLGKDEKGAKLQPKESTVLPPFGDPDAKKVRVMLGAEGPQQEIFTIKY